MDKEHLISQMTDYIINVLEEKRPEFSGFAVCPFVRADRVSDQLHMDIFDNTQETLVDVVLRFVRSGKRSALIGQPNVKVEVAETQGYQEFINIVLEESGNSSVVALCFNPDTKMEVEGYSAYSSIPFFLINFAYRKDLKKARDSLSKTNYYDKLPEKYRKFLKML